MSDPTPKTLGQIAFLEHHVRGFPHFTEEAALSLWRELEERERVEWEWAANAVLDEAAKAIEKLCIHTGAADPDGIALNEALKAIRALKTEIPE